jgi:hypothetical protein
MEEDELKDIKEKMLNEVRKKTKKKVPFYQVDYMRGTLR